MADFQKVKVQRNIWAKVLEHLFELSGGEFENITEKANSACGFFLEFY